MMAYILHFSIIVHLLLFKNRCLRETAMPHKGKTSCKNFYRQSIGEFCRFQTPLETQYSLIQKKTYHLPRADRKSVLGTAKNGLLKISRYGIMVVQRLAKPSNSNVVQVRPLLSALRGISASNDDSMTFYEHATPGESRC